MNDDIQVLDTGQDTDTSTYTPYEMIGFENGTLVTPASANLETGAVTMPVYSGRTPVNDANLNHLEQGLKDLETYILTGGSVFGGNNPIGSISLWNTSTPPVGYLICDGSTYNKSSYPDLYDALGSDYQISAEQFKVPDFRGLVPIGAGAHQDTNDKSKTFELNTEYGEYEHTQTINEMPLHNHTSENEQFSTALTPKTRINTGGTESGVANNPTGYTGGGQPFNVMQPSLTVNYIIKAVKSDTTLAEIENSLASDSTTNAPSIHAVNELVNYSATEKIVGKWIDNKPAYKKVILTTTPAEKTNAEIYDCTNENIDTLIKCDSLIISSVSGDTLNGNYYYSATNNCFVFYNSVTKKINMQLNSDTYHSETCYIFLEYTKTTD